MVLSLIGPLDNHRVQRILLVAAFAGTRLKVVPVTIGKENETESYYLNCHPLGRVPALRSDEGYLFETNAIIRYLARTERPYGPDGSEKTLSPQLPVPYVLYGRSLQEAAEVDAWLDFVLTELDPHTSALRHAERQSSPAPAAAAEKLSEGLHGLEQRIAHLKLLKRSGGGAGGPCGANGTLQEEAEDGMSDEGHYGTGTTPRESTKLRECSTYNISGQIRARLEPLSLPVMRGSSGGDGLPHAVPQASPRASAKTPRESAALTKTPRGSTVSSSDMLFLVRESLTAADLVVALAVHTALSVRKMNAELKKRFPLCVRFANSVLRLPLAADLRKALGIGLH